VVRLYDPFCTGKNIVFCFVPRNWKSSTFPFAFFLSSIIRPTWKWNFSKKPLDPELEDRKKAKGKVEDFQFLGKKQKTIFSCAKRVIQMDRRGSSGHWRARRRKLYSLNEGLFFGVESVSFQIYHRVSQSEYLSALTTILHSSLENDSPIVCCNSTERMRKARQVFVEFV